MKSRLALALALWLSGMAPDVLAHAGGEAGSDMGGALFVGLAHPFGGIDHLLAMFAVGLWAATQGRQAVWLAPVGFVSGLSLGGSFGMMALPSFIAVEPGIRLSLVVIGLALVWGGRVGLPVLLALVGGFGFCHGYAHGRELGAGQSPLGYGLGFVIGSASLHFAGVLAALAANGLKLPLRLAGAMVAGVGVSLSFL